MGTGLQAMIKLSIIYPPTAVWRYYSTPLALVPRGVSLRRESSLGHQQPGSRRTSGGSTPNETAVLGTSLLFTYLTFLLWLAFSLVLR